ncbi:hypothetical protein M2T37_27795, partial [Klebsiella pneumoniae]|uniref:hypothetical protein n=1 Tax=Klebsiella pneumoniae TaxID=573 RepID=UPI00200E4C32|nr:hypothetical protein [Klebsiella pneumoniae]
LALMQQLAESREPLERARGLVGLTGIAIRQGKATERKQEIAQALDLLRPLPQAAVVFMRAGNHKAATGKGLSQRRRLALFEKCAFVDPNNVEE